LGHDKLKKPEMIRVLVALGMSGKKCGGLMLCAEDRQNHAPRNQKAG